MPNERDRSKAKWQLQSKSPTKTQIEGRKEYAPVNERSGSGLGDIAEQMLKSYRQSSERSNFERPLREQYKGPYKIPDYSNEQVAIMSAAE